jgi:hypothetical protein
MTNYAYGQSWPVIRMCNYTFVTSDEINDDSSLNWRNAVYLWNQITSVWDLQHKYDYVATEAQQKPTNLGDAWGPIIETFQASYADTNPMGALVTGLRAEDAAGQWSPWALLAAQDSYLRYGGIGFKLELISRNNAFVATS